MSQRWRAGLYDLLHQRHDFAAEAEQVRSLVQARNASANTLLDVACGTGRHLDYFRRWYEVAGIDRSPSMLAAARRRLPGIPLRRADMRAFDLGSPFDVVTCLSSAIAYVESVPEMCAAIACMANHLNAGGVLVVEPWDEPDSDKSNTEPWVESVGDSEQRLVCMETTNLRGDAWFQDTHYLLWSRDAGIRHIREHVSFSAFCRRDYELAFTRAGLAFEYDDTGLKGRGLCLGVRRESSPGG